ncbi:hypothetical protein [Streptomyces sp. NPDC006334]|uniref:hypothetical protein n=1 Tax=Streptomyces sp. NPDC006334 TaxID=3156754 RepID=UPI0033A5600E
MNELVREHTKADLLCMACAGGLVNHHSPEKWRKDDIATAVVDIEFGAGRPALTTA